MKRNVFISLSFLILVFCITDPVKSQYRRNQQKSKQKKVSPEVKKQVKGIFENYEAALNALGDTTIAPGKKNKALKQLRKDFYSDDVYVWNDLDTVSGEDDFISITEYIRKFPEVFRNGAGILLNTSDIKVKPVEANQARNTYQLKAMVQKMTKFHTINVTRDTVFTPVFNDSLTTFLGSDTLTDTLSTDSLRARMDSLHTDSVFVRDSLGNVKDTAAYVNVSRDTIDHKRIKPLVFYIRLDKNKQDEYENFKIFAITRPGNKPRLLPLPDNVKWWVSLEDPWKEVFKNKLNLSRFPSEHLIDRAFYLRKININGHSEIDDLKPLKQMNRLEELHLANTKVSDLTPIENKTHLKELDINNTKVDTLKAVTGLKNLEVLKFRNIEEHNISELEGLDKLQELDASKNRIEDISPLSEMKDLEILDLSLNTEIDTLTPLRDLEKLEDLRLRKAKIKSLEAISNCKDLVVLDCFNTEIKTLEPISSLKKIMILDIGYTRVDNLRSIKNHRYIKELYLQGTPISNINPVKRYKHLEKLNISKTSVSNLNAVEGLPHIMELRCHHTDISENEVDRFKKDHPKCDIYYY